MSGAVLKRLVETFEDQVLETHSQCGDDTVVLKRDRIHDVAQWLRDDPANAFNFFRDITATDLQTHPDGQPFGRFEVVIHLYSISKKHAIRLKVPLSEDDCCMDTLSDLWPAANWGEREVWDMYGVRFNAHPDLRRVLLYEEFEGHPLRKDYDKRLSQPRIDLRSPERDAIQEYKHWEKGGEFINRDDVNYE